MESRILVGLAVSVILIFSGPSAEADFSMLPLPKPTVTTAGFGWTVAGLGDINNDGVPDFAVSQAVAPTMFVRAYSGATRSVLGSVQDTSANNTRIGFSVSALADVNSDGFKDFLVGDTRGVNVSPSCTAGSLSPNANYTGRVHIVSGQNAQTILSTFQGALNGGFGHSVASIGDINADGVRDFLVGEPWGDKEFGQPCDRSRGKLWVISGATGSTIRTHISGPFSTVFAANVSGVGDVNLDGKEDYASGANNSTVVFSGANGATLSTIAFKSVGRSPIRPLGDVNGDSVPDFIIGDESAGSNTGEVRIYSGATFGVLRTLYGAYAGERFGAAVSGLGDANSDGIPDVAVMASADAVSGGRVVVYSGSDGQVIGNIFSGSRKLYSGTIDLVGYLDGDAIQDLIIGAPSDEGSPANSANPGNVFVAPKSKAAGCSWREIDGLTVCL